MPRMIIKLTDESKKDYYLEWSTVVDAPVTYGLSLHEFKMYYQTEYGKHGVHGLEDRLARVEEKGTSSQVHESLDELISSNRAGKDEAEISKEEIIQRYCIDRNA